MSGPADAEALPRLPPAYRLVSRPSIGSTNDEAKRLAGEGAEEGTLVWAHEQLSGRGRRGNDWASPPGNLYLSLVLRPEVPIGQAGQLGFVAALAVGDAVGSLAPPLEVTYKWPNDVLVNGRKGAGLLIESELGPAGALQWLVLGVGVNLASHPEGTDFPATDLAGESGIAAPAPERALEAFARHFLRRVGIWREEGFAPIRKDWLAHAYRLGEAITVRLGQETLEGIFRDLDEAGALVLEASDGERRLVPAGAVFPPAEGAPE